MTKIRLPVKKAGEKKKKEYNHNEGFILDKDGCVPLCKENVIAILAYFVFNEPIDYYLGSDHGEDIDIKINKEKEIALVYVPYEHYKEAYFDPLNHNLLFSCGGPYDGYKFSLIDEFSGEIYVLWKFNRCDVNDIVQKEQQQAIDSLQNKRNEYEY